MEQFLTSISREIFSYEQLALITNDLIFSQLRFRVISCCTMMPYFKYLIQSKIQTGNKGVLIHILDLIVN